MRTSLLATLISNLPLSLENNDDLLVGFSGGRDSVVLLYLFKQLLPFKNLNLSAVHVNHQMSSYSNDWACFCRDFCAHLEVPITIEKVFIRNKGKGIEAEAREKRFAVFNSIQHDWLALGHHSQDQSETVLHNLSRGAGLRGAVGMLFQKDKIIRPLLSVSRDDITFYARQNKLSWIEDASNQDISLTRNYIRHVVLPAIHQKFPSFDQRILRTSQHFFEAFKLLDDLAEIDLSESVAEFDFPISLELLRSLSEPRARNVIRYLLYKNNVMISSEKKLKEWVRQARCAERGKRPKVFFGNTVVKVDKGKIVLQS